MIKQYEIPDVRDGLTSLQRRILWTMKSMELTSRKPYRKAQSVIFEAGKDENLDGHHNRSHFSTSDYNLYGALKTIYDHTMVPLTQKWRHPYPLIEGHGNWGWVIEDGAAAPIFTECRLTEFTEKALLTGLNQRTVKYIWNPTLKKNEPTVLPARVPNVLIAGTSGSSHIPPHNLGEVIDACVAILKNRALKPEQLLDYIQGPDFPTGGTIINKSELREIYQNGAGEIRIRGMMESEPTSKGEKQIIVREIPYPIIGKVKEFADNLEWMQEFDILPDIKNLEEGPLFQPEEIHITVKRDADIQRNMELLYEYTDLESSFDYRALLISNGKPKLMSLHQIMTEWLDFYRETMTKLNRGTGALISALENLSDESAFAKADFNASLYNTDRGTGAVIAALENANKAKQQNQS